jgi:hypothetical protein
MSGFCSQNTETITETNYTDSYPGRLSCLPNGGSGWPASSVDSKTGLVSSKLVDSQIAALLSRKITYNDENGRAVDVAPTAPSLTQTSDYFPQVNTNPANAFSTTASILRTNIQNEYCFYYKRYMYILKDILNIAAMSKGSNLTSNTGYQKKKLNTEAINLKLNQILQILQGLVNSRLVSLNQYYGPGTGVNQVNRELDINRNDLIRHTNLLKNSEMEKEVQAAMIDYTIEKNSSSRNLLAIYGFLNIVAVGMLFYLYRSTK